MSEKDADWQEKILTVLETFVEIQREQTEVLRGIQEEIAGINDTMYVATTGLKEETEDIEEIEDAEEKSLV